MTLQRFGMASLVCAACVLAACNEDSSTAPGSQTQTFRATMNAANEISTPDTNSATGTGTATFTVHDTTVTFSVVVTGLTGAANGAHIHGPLSTDDAQENKGLVVNISSFTTLGTGTSGTLMTGSFGPSKVLVAAGITQDQATQIVANPAGYYFNVHTALHPGGEIRGTIRPVASAAGTSNPGY